MKLTARYQVPQVSALFRKELDEHLKHVLVEATKAYLHATVDTIPVYGGASRATFSPLASEVEFALLISPVVESTIAIGEAMGQARFVAGPSEYSFTYMTTLPHLVTNEYYDATKFGIHLKSPGPYQFQERGQLAFWDTVSSLLEWPALSFDTRSIDAR